MSDVKIEKVYSRREEICNIITHALGVVLILCGVPFIVRAAMPAVLGVCSVLIYSAAMLTMFGCSAVYHAARKPEFRVNMRKMDHAAIYVQIAGTYTPLMLAGAGGKAGLVILLINWLLAVAGVVSEITLWKPFKHFSLVVYLLMGWLCVAVLPAMIRNMELSSLLWLGIGGVIYTLGVVFYVSRREFSHAIWHLFVLGGALCHWIAVFLLTAGNR